MINSAASTGSKVTPERCINSLLRFLLKSNRVEKKHSPLLINSTLEVGLDVGLFLTKKIKATRIKEPVNRASFKEKKKLPVYPKYRYIFLIEDPNYTYKSVLSSDEDIVLLIPAPKEKVKQIFSLM